MSEQKKMNRGFDIGVGIFVVVIFACAIYFSQRESSVCHQFRPYYYKEINARIVKKYYCVKAGRRIGCIDIVDQYKEYHFDGFNSHDPFDKLQPGDSVSKPSGNSNFEFYRKGEFLGGMYWNCEPPDTLQNSQNQ